MLTGAGAVDGVGVAAGALVDAAGDAAAGAGAAAAGFAGTGLLLLTMTTNV